VSTSEFVPVSGVASCRALPVDARQRGAAIARMEARVALATLLDRFATIELREPAPQWRLDTAVRTFEALPVHLAP
jgi:hypothetical protein